MNTAETIENILRPHLQALGIMGTRGPAKAHVFPMLLVAILAIVGFFTIVMNVIEYFFLKKCPMCGKKHD
jgi:hypothetical protein